MSGAGTDVPELAGLDEAEDFFEALGVPFRAEVLATLRLRVMKRFGLSLGELRQAGLPGDPALRRAALAAALRDAHDLVARNGAREGSLVGGPPLVKLGIPKAAR